MVLCDFFISRNQPPSAQISLCANLTHPKRKKKKKKKKINSVKSKRVWHVLKLVEATLLPLTQDSYMIIMYIKIRLLYLNII
jgi:hypothetical protein